MDVPLPRSGHARQHVSDLPHPRPSRWEHPAHQASPRVGRNHIPHIMPSIPSCIIEIYSLA
jgi:hypothetical protein